MAARHSFEFFPAKTPAGHAKLLDTARELASTSPEFFSCTYGAGGSTRDRTFETVKELVASTSVPTAPHLSCIGATRDELLDVLTSYRQAGVRRIVALRGDLPSGMGPGVGELRYARDLVALIREAHGDHFEIEVAAYPEVHPQAKSADTDLQHFVEKARAGATRAITQYFYHPDAYFHFVDRVRALGCDIPIVPGIMPITNLQRLARFSDACGAEIPRFVRKRLEALGEDEAAMTEVGTEIVARLVERLLAGGAPSIHFYTLNTAGPSLAIGRAAGMF